MWYEEIMTHQGELPWSRDTWLGHYFEWCVTCKLLTGENIVLALVQVTQSCPALCPMNSSPWNSPGQTVGVGSLLFSRGSSKLRDWTQVSHIAGRFFTSWATREAQEYWSGYPISSPGDLPNPGIKLGSPALQADSLPTELSGELIFKFCLSLPSKLLQIGIKKSLKRNSISVKGEMPVNCWMPL